jgi:hypothetical protein
VCSVLRGHAGCFHCWPSGVLSLPVRPPTTTTKTQMKSALVLLWPGSRINAASVCYCCRFLFRSASCAGCLSWFFHSQLLPVLCLGTRQGCSTVRRSLQELRPCQAHLSFQWGMQLRVASGAGAPCCCASQSRTVRAAVWECVTVPVECSMAGCCHQHACQLAQRQLNLSVTGVC